MEQSAQKPSWAITDGNFIVCRPHSSLCPDEPKKEIDCEEGVQEVGSGEKKLLVKSVRNISEFKLSLHVLRHLGQQPVMMGRQSARECPALTFDELWRGERKCKNGSRPNYAPTHHL